MVPTEAITDGHQYTWRTSLFLLPFLIAVTGLFGQAKIAFSSIFDVHNLVSIKRPIEGRRVDSLTAPVVVAQADPQRRIFYFGNDQIILRKLKFHFRVDGKSRYSCVEGIIKSVGTQSGITPFFDFLFANKIIFDNNSSPGYLPGVSQPIRNVQGRGSTLDSNAIAYEPYHWPNRKENRCIVHASLFLHFIPHHEIDACINDGGTDPNYRKYFLPSWCAFVLALCGISGISWGWWNLRDNHRIPFAIFAFIIGIIALFAGTIGILNWSR